MVHPLSTNPKPAPPAHTLTLVSSATQATAAALAASYASSFNLDTFYPAAAQLQGVEGAEAWHEMQLRKVAYASLANPGHEVWCVLGEVWEGEGEVEEKREGEEGEEGGEVEGEDELKGREVAALVVLKLPGCPPDAPTPYDAALARLPAPALERFHELLAHSSALTARSWPGNECLHISWLGTRRGYEGRGMGGALMRMALGRAREMGVPVRLSTQSRENVSFYEYLGFEAKGYGEWEIAGVPHTFWVMVAEPKAKEEGKSAQVANGE